MSLRGRSEDTALSGYRGNARLLRVVDEQRGAAALGDIGLTDLSQAHGRWRLTDSRLLGSDRLDVYERVREG